MSQLNQSFKKVIKIHYPLADCRPSIIKNIKFSENYLFLVA